MKLEPFSAVGMALALLLVACEKSADPSADTQTTSAPGTSTSVGGPAPVVAATATRGKSTSAGDPALFPYGYYDISGRGSKDDFCQVEREGHALSCDTGSVVVRSGANLDLGYPGTGQMEDANGDGKDDFCRCVGDPPTVAYACLVSNGTTFAEDPYGFKPPGRTSCDTLNAQTEAPPEPAPPAPPKPQIPVGGTGKCAPHGAAAPCTCPNGQMGMQSCDANVGWTLCSC
ncbi:MAG: hypothetical protein KC731_19755 [Myxococcales bacterium]|nr:hypothetical protein [Myxococcales bacterium]